VKSGRMLAVAAALVVILIVGVSASGFAADAPATAKAAKPVMHTYVIERTIPGAGKLSKKELHDISVKSNGVLKEMGPDIKWVDSFVTDDKVYCIYKAKNEELVREHAKRGGFPADKVSEVKTMISPATGK
jgi:uncharacterized protein DUF4242